MAFAGMSMSCYSAFIQSDNFTRAPGLRASTTARGRSAAAWLSFADESRRPCAGRHDDSMAGTDSAWHDVMESIDACVEIMISMARLPAE